MFKYLFIIAFLLKSLLSFSQVEGKTKIDTVIHTEAYISYYSFKTKTPIAVSYILYKGGGSCSRKNLKFKSGGLRNSATLKDYSKSKYDMGHLANAEDFANNCRLDSLTFRFWNCFPQTPDLNRGLWKTMETEVRDLSQNDSLVVICGGFYGDKTIGNDKVYVPEKCWKIVYSIKQKDFIRWAIFDNEFENSKKIVDETPYVLINELKQQYNLDIRRIVLTH